MPPLNPAVLRLARGSFKHAQPRPRNWSRFGGTFLSSSRCGPQKHVSAVLSHYTPSAKARLQPLTQDPGPERLNRSSISEDRGGACRRTDPSLPLSGTKRQLRDRSTRAKTSLYTGDLSNQRQDGGIYWGTLFVWRILSI